LKDRAFSFAQKEALTMPEVILSDYFYGDEDVQPSKKPLNLIALFV
jgi:hypothetical protein